MAKHRDKARIKPFCDQLAQLWETHGPDLRFGQIISCLPLAIHRPGHDPFFVEENEMLEALQRTFRVDQDVGDVLHIAHFMRAAPNLQQWVVGSRQRVGGIEQQAM